MDFQNQVKSHITTPELAAVCKFCHHGMRFGRIACDIEVDLAEFTTPKHLDVTPLMLYSEPSDLSRASIMGPWVISYACPECGCPTMMVDAEMGELVSCFNQLAIYTKFSCAGHGEGGMYIRCFDPMPDALQERFRKCRETTIEDDGKSLYLTTVDAKGNSTHRHTEELAIEIRELWFSVLDEYSTTPEADVYAEEQRKKWPNLQARYFDVLEKRMLPEEDIDAEE